MDHKEVKMNVLNIAVAVLWVDFFNVCLDKFRKYGKSTLSEWYTKYKLLAVISDSSIFILCIMIAKYFVGSSSLFNLILACGCVQITHDVLFNYLVIQPVPRGTNEILDLFKDFVVQNTWKIVLTDFIMITASVGGAYLLSRQSTETNTFIGILGVYCMTYILYNK